MDLNVIRAMQKWPDVPACYGWLRLDRRGYWRLRDAAAQAGNLPGDIVHHDGFNQFISRHYLCDFASGATAGERCWYFQNGPQKVFVDLETTPYIARLMPTEILLHTGQPLPVAHIDKLLLRTDGALLLVARPVASQQPVPIQIDDRDLLSASAGFFSTDGRDTDLLLEAACDAGNEPANRAAACAGLGWRHATLHLPVGSCEPAPEDANSLAALFHYQRLPRP